MKFSGDTWFAGTDLRHAEKRSPQTHGEGAESAPSPGLKKVSFGAITKKKEDSKTAYPILPDPNGEAAKIAARIIERTGHAGALAYRIIGRPASVQVDPVIINNP